LLTGTGLLIGAAQEPFAQVLLFRRQPACASVAQATIAIAITIIMPIFFILNSF
jgi:hypothetical protein